LPELQNTFFRCDTLLNVKVDVSNIGEKTFLFCLLIEINDTLGIQKIDYPYFRRRNGVGVFFQFCIKLSNVRAHKQLVFTSLNN
jgi:hypothetical protein